MKTGAADSVKARDESNGACVVCGSEEGDDGGGNCRRCGNRLSISVPTARAGAGTKVGNLTVIRPHGEGDLLASEPTGETRLIVFGTEEAVARETSALETLAQAGAAFPTVVRRGVSPDVGHYVVLTTAVDGAAPLLEIELTFEAALALVDRVLDAADVVDRSDLTWEPSPTDIYLKEGGDIAVMRARGARKRLVREPFDAKRVIEALAGTLVPRPFGAATPDVVRLLLPKLNFSSVERRSVADARDDFAHAARLQAGKRDARLAELCDAGLRRNHNEDATATASGDISGEPFAVLVVCDGVSSSTHAGKASAIASRVARDGLVRRLTDGHAPTQEAMIEAIRAAHAEVCAEALDYGDGTPPGTTIVAAVVFRETLTVGWVGDSRAYWVSEQGSEQCTVDHSWINEALGSGAISLAEAMESPLAHAITRCLGPLEGGAGGSREVEPDVRTRVLSPPGHVILCSDGLWNYFPSAQAVEALVRETGAQADAETIARFLVCRALAEGGGDNVSVAVYTLGRRG